MISVLFCWSVEIRSCDSCIKIGFTTMNMEQRLFFVQLNDRSTWRVNVCGKFWLQIDESCYPNNQNGASNLMNMIVRRCSRFIYEPSIKNLQQCSMQPRRCDPGHIHMILYPEYSLTIAKYQCSSDFQIVVHELRLFSIIYLFPD